MPCIMFMCFRQPLSRDIIVKFSMFLCSKVDAKWSENQFLVNDAFNKVFFGNW